MGKDDFLGFLLREEVGIARTGREVEFHVEVAGELGAGDLEPSADGHDDVFLFVGGASAGGFFAGDDVLGLYRLLR